MEQFWDFGSHGAACIKLGVSIFYAALTLMESTEPLNEGRDSNQMKTKSYYCTDEQKLMDTFMNRGFVFDVACCKFPTWHTTLGWNRLGESNHVESNRITRTESISFVPAFHTAPYRSFRSHTITGKYLLLLLLRVIFPCSLFSLTHQQYCWLIHAL